MFEERFVGTWERIGGDRIAAGQIHNELCSRYDSPGRHYHTSRHIVHCLRQLDAARDGIVNPDLVEIALWFHDVIYEPKSKRNESRSAELFLSLAAPLPQHVRQTVTELIMITVHPSDPQSTDQETMVDIDLSSFGLPWPEFLRDSRDVRAEFSHLTHELFLAAQGAFLRRLVQRERFYFTPFFFQRYELRARENINRYLDLMSASATST